MKERMNKQTTQSQERGLFLGEEYACSVNFLNSQQTSATSTYLMRTE